MPPSARRRRCGVGVRGSQQRRPGSGTRAAIRAGCCRRGFRRDQAAGNALPLSTRLRPKPHGASKMLARARSLRSSYRLPAPLGALEIESDPAPVPVGQRCAGTSGTRRAMMTAGSS
jgi:hypothetical protein